MARTRSKRGGCLGIAIALFALLLGAGLIAYPAVSAWVHQQSQYRIIHQQQEAVQNKSQDDLAAERARAIDYNTRLLNGKVIITDPFDESKLRPTDKDYESVMNLRHDGVMGMLTIPKIHFQMSIYHGTTEKALQQGVGHLLGTSVPIGGDSTHSVLSGHTGLPSAKIFDNLDRLKTGDYFVLTVLGEDHAYRVSSIEVVLPEQTDSLTVQDGKDLVTLVTCTPYGVNTHRLLVHAERCPVPAEWKKRGEGKTFPDGYGDPPDRSLLPSMAIGAGLALIVILLVVVISRLRRRRRDEIS